MKNLYQILALSANATQSEIKRAYRRLALINHPDKEGGSEEAMNELNEAYETLGDPEKRSEYDLSWSVFQHLSDEAPTPLSGYLSSSDASLSFSFSFKSEHVKFVALGAQQGVEQFSAKTRLTPFQTDLYSYDEVIYSDLIAYLNARHAEPNGLVVDEIPADKEEEQSNDSTLEEAKVNTGSNLFTRFFSGLAAFLQPEEIMYQEPPAEHEEEKTDAEEVSMAELNEIFPGEFNVDTALNLFMQFLAGQYHGEQLKKLHIYFNKNTDTFKKTHSDAPELQVFEAFFTVIDIIVNERPAHSCLVALERIVSYVKELPQLNQQSFLALFCNPYYRAFYAYVQHEQWLAPLDLFASDLIKNFDGYEQGVEKLEALKTQFMNSRDTKVLNAAQQMKLLIKLEQALQASSLERNAADYRAHAFTLLDWFPAINEHVTSALYANLFMQIGLKFQQASVLESQLALKHADEQLALKMYLSAYAVTEKSAPDLSLYVMGLIITFLAQFTCDSPQIEEVLPELQKNMGYLLMCFPAMNTRALMWSSYRKTIKRSP